MIGPDALLKEVLIAILRKQRDWCCMVPVSRAHRGRGSGRVGLEWLGPLLSPRRDEMDVRACRTGFPSRYSENHSPPLRKAIDCFIVEAEHPADRVGLTAWSRHASHLSGRQRRHKEARARGHNAKQRSSLLLMNWQTMQDTTGRALSRQRDPRRNMRR